MQKKKEDRIENPTLLLVKERDIALDFATKAYRKFGEMIKSIFLFGSSAKKTSVPSSDIDIVIIIDDVSIRWDQELIAYYREELGKLIAANPYKKPLHINTVRLSTWWDDLRKGDPIVINAIRYGDPLIDFGGFFSPLKILLQQGKISPTPEAIYNLLNRAPTHLIRAKSMLHAIVDSFYWCCVDAAHAALIAADEQPASPEHIYHLLKRNFVDRGLLKSKYADYYQEIFELHKKLEHGNIKEIEGKYIDELLKKSDDFLKEMSRIIEEILDSKI
ncbi:MAG: nucleotidyltransferase domain-containing protein [Candidatus Pacearchaeota archaeon]